MTSSHAQQVEDLHIRCLKLLQEKPDISQRELAEQIGPSPGKMNYCLSTLIDKCLLKLENLQNNQHKLKYAYRTSTKPLETFALSD